MPGQAIGFTADDASRLKASIDEDPGQAVLLLRTDRRRQAGGSRWPEAPALLTTTYVCAFTPELKQPIAHLLKAKALRTEGRARGTKSFAGGGKRKASRARKK